MAYQVSEFRGDEIYKFNCTGDAVTGDEVCFERATFTGSFRNAKFAGFEKVSGKIVSDSYGCDKQQHTFTLELADGSTLKIKGRNLYANGTYRKAWPDESLRRAAAADKHARGDRARAAREIRKSVQFAY